MRKINGQVLKSEKELETLEKARNYFPCTSDFMIKGLGIDLSKRSAARRFYKIMNGTQNKRTAVSTEDWFKISEYAKRFDQGEYYDPETFKIPDISQLQKTNI